MPKLHPDCRCDPAVRVDAGAYRRCGELRLRYRLSGIDNLRVPATAPSRRRDKLWQHTCFEAFLRGSSGDGYLELNFSPSTEWAAYRFSGYRTGMATAEEIVPEIAATNSPDFFELNVRVNLDAVAELADCPAWHVALSAVVEETNGRQSYWALAHPPGKPDFHHRDGFVLALAG